jgi:hypothetical protein
MPFILVLRRQRQADFCKFETSLVCIFRESSRTARAIQRNPVWKNNNNNNSH